MFKTFCTSAGLAAVALILSATGMQPALAMVPSIVAAASSFCAVSDRDAAVLHPAPVDMPPIALLQGAEGTARVRVDLTAAGTVENTAIAASSGNRWLDAEAIRVAHASTFLPEIRGCEPVAGAYIYEVSFLR